MDLFSTGEPYNVLPYDGTAVYYGPVLSFAASDDYKDYLLEHTPWRNDEAIMFGKHIVTARKVAWYSDYAQEYKYAGVVHTAAGWSPELLQLKDIVESRTASSFNACLLNLYHSGAEGMGWHSDEESSTGYGSTIASLSFGAERTFCFKHKKTKETISIVLEHGGLLVMKDDTQSHWLHCVPKTKKISQPRINMTFRQLLV